MYVLFLSPPRQCSLKSWRYTLTWSTVLCSLTLTTDFREREERSWESGFPLKMIFWRALATGSRRSFDKSETVSLSCKVLSCHSRPLNSLRHWHSMSGRCVLRLSSMEQPEVGSLLHEAVTLLKFDACVRTVMQEQYLVHCMTVNAHRVNLPVFLYI